MADLYRRLAVFVDRTSPGNFVWVLMESTDDPAVWLDLETADESFDNWREAYDAGNEALMADYPVENSSIQMRERIVLPLVTIQQYALMQVRELKDAEPIKEKYEKLAMRCSFGIINAGRNSA